MDSVPKLSELSEKILSYEKTIRELINIDLNSSSYFLTLYAILNNIYPTYLAPAYHCRKYCELLKNPNSLGIFNNSIDSKVTNSLLRIEFQETIVSIKALLDRTVKLLAIKYKGISTETTFGRYDKNNNKGRGLMNFAYKLAEKDEYMKLLVFEYESWISKAIMPRDKVVHYNDLPIIYRIKFNPESPFYDDIPTIVHLDKNLKDSIDIENVEQIDQIAYDKETIIKFVKELYTLIDYTIETIIKK
jgi:hypothetical protein